MVEILFFTGADFIRDPEAFLASQEVIIGSSSANALLKRMKL
jgi:hypothetical protein